ncbi:MAG: aldo/keto reductase [Anaerolineae bacterium]|jgi:predicted aldo/keto reductase-like oxidoreductase
MKTTTLGRTGLQVSRIGFGGIPIQRVSEEEAVRVVLRCIELGVTFLDTANAYSNSEARIGKALAALPDQRERLVIATKTAARDRATAWRHLEQSRRHLGIDVVDLWQLHNVSSMDAYEQVLAPGGALEAAQEALETGLVRHIGITSHSMDVALKGVPSGHFETVQFPFNFVTNEPADKLLPLARQHGLGFIAMKPLGGGMLSDANLAIKYLLQFDHVVPDPGIERVEEIEEIAAIVTGSWDLTPQERQEIELIRNEVGVRFCRRCGYCEPCPEDVRISLVMNLPSVWKRMPVERLTTGNLAAALQTGRNCIECGQCEEKCPYQLPIREMIAEYMAVYEETLQAEGLG